MTLRGYGDGSLSPMRSIESIDVLELCCGRPCWLPWLRKTERVVVVAVAVVAGPLLGIGVTGHMHSLHLLVRSCVVKVSIKLWHHYSGLMFVVRQDGTVQQDPEQTGHGRLA